MRFDLKKILLAFGTALTLAAATTARASLLAYDGMDYTANAQLVGQAGGSGFAGAWLLNGGSAGPNSVILPGSFGFTDVNGYSLVTTGNRAHFTGDGSATGDNLSGGVSASANPLRILNFARGADGSTASTWISFLTLRTGLPNPTPGSAPNDYLYGRAAGTQFFYNASGSTSVAAGSEMFSFGRGTQSSETLNPALPNDTWGMLQQGNANAVKVSNVGMASAPADFILIRVDHTGSTVNDAANGDTMRVWINPPDLNSAPADGLADIVFKSDEFNGSIAGLNRDWVFDRVRLFGGNAQTTPSGRSYGSAEVDELRIGETFVDVTPNVIPEPTVAIIGGLGLLAFWIRRRR